MSRSRGSLGLGSTMNLACGSEKHSNMKQFIYVALEYNRTQSETCAKQLNRHLQMIVVSSDLSTFDPNSSVVVEFFVSLRQLLYGLESPNSALLWGGVDVLQQACRNRATQHALIHTYHFLPIFTRFLSDQMIDEKKIRLLTLIQELSYGIRITWQEVHIIPQLIATMVKWIGSGETNVVNLSLLILINFLYKNTPAMYTLMRCVDTEVFMRTVTSLEGSNIEVHIFKLLIILENINGEVPQEDLLIFVAATFESVANALKNRDVVLLRHVVDFFIDVKSEQKRFAFAKFKDYQPNIKKLIEIANNMKNEGGDNEIDPECITKLFEFLLALVQLDLPDIRPFHSQFAHLALNWVQTERYVSSTALKLLRSYLATAKDVDAEQFMQPLSSGLPVLLETLNAGCSSEDQEVQSTEDQERLTGLFHLLRELIKCRSLQENIVQGLEMDSIHKLFIPLLSLSFSPRIRCNEPFSNEASTLLYINALALVQELAPLDHQWQSFYVQLMADTQIHTMIAYAFCKGDADVKSLIFQLARTGEFINQTDGVAQAFDELQSMFEYNARNNDRISNTFAEQQLPAYTIMSVMQEEKLDTLIQKLEAALANNQIANAATTDFIKLFIYKMENMGHAERAAQVSLEAAGKQAAQRSAESARLHQMLFHSQKCQEQTTAKLTEVEGNMRQTVVQLATAKTQCMELENQLKACQAQLQAKNNELSPSEEKYQSALVKISELEVDLANKTQKNADLYKMVKKQEDEIVYLDKKVEEKKNWVVKVTQKNSKLSKEVETYQKLCKRNEDQLAQKEKENLDLQAKLEDYESRFNWIVQISMNKVDRTNDK